MKKILFLFFFLSVPSFLFAQWNEVGILLGASNYKGQLSATMFNTYFLHPAGGAFYRHNFNRRWSYRFMGNYAYISGNDSRSDFAYDRNRNLSFQSPIYDASFFLEFNFFPYETGDKRFAWTPYMFTGLSVFKFNPEAQYDGHTYDLQPLGTEGENLPGGPGGYSLISYALPIGGGIKVSVGRFGFALELCARRTYTNYLDDVSTTYPNLKLLRQYDGPIAVALSDRSLPSSNPADSLNTIYVGKQRGSPELTDWYIIGGLSIYMRLGGRLKDPCKSNFIRKKY